MKPKEYRDRLFKDGKPNIRPLTIFTEDGGYSQDMNVLWGAYRQGSFPALPEMDQEEFADFMVNDALSGYNAGWMIEDKNKGFKDGKGPIGFFAGAYNGWELEPHFESFSWSTPRNKLRAVVSFLQMMKYDKEIGIVNVYSLNDDEKFYKKMKNYGVLYYVGKVPNGDSRGDRHIFFVRGKKRVEQ